MHGARRHGNPNEFGPLTHRQEAKLEGTKHFYSDWRLWTALGLAALLIAAILLTR